MNSDKSLYSAKLRSLMLTKSNPCYITVSATLVLLGVGLTMPRPRLFSVLIFSTKHISLRREQNSKHYCLGSNRYRLGSKRPAKDYCHEFTYIMPRPRRIGCIIFVISCHDLFYVSLNKSQQPILLYLHLISYINKVLLCLSVIVGVLSLLILISHLIIFHYFFLIREFATLTVGLWILIKN